jgi:hypothetical protein|nr:MAG TPA: S4 domain [Siphoviridae sp. ctqOv4]
MILKKLYKGHSFFGVSGIFIPVFKKGKVKINDQTAKIGDTVCFDGKRLSVERR